MLNLTIEKMTYGIDSLSHHNGKVVFVPYGAPGDQVEVEITDEKADFIRTDITKIVQPSPLRRASPCPHFPECGGCHWLHLPGETQRQEKEAYLKFLMRPLNPGRLYPLEALPEDGYRNKMDLKVRVEESGKVVLGNYRFRSHDVVDMTHCRVQCAPNMELYRKLQAFLTDKPDRARSIDQISARTLGAQQHATVFLKDAPTEERVAEWRGFFDATGTLAKLEILHGNTACLTLMREQAPFTFMNRVWNVSPRSFFQNNLEGAEAIYYTLQSVYEGVQPKGKFIDLYCGIGVQTMLLERRFEEVVAVECNEDSFRDALVNQRGRRQQQIRFICRKAEAIFATPLIKGSIAAVHMNPPRTGLSPKVIRSVGGIKPRLISYLSCNPLTFKRDAQAIAQMGYRLESVHAFDLFPGTFHLEILGTFTR